jgi:hypothetical protein
MEHTHMSIFLVVTTVDQDDVTYTAHSTLDAAKQAVLDDLRYGYDADDNDIEWEVQTPDLMTAEVDNAYVEIHRLAVA